MTRSGLVTAIFLSCFMAALLIPASHAAAQASAIDAAKEAGQLGERYDGYLGVVNPDASEDVKSLAQEINRKRREKYEEIGRSNSVSAAQVGRIAGAKLLEQALEGEHVMPREGQWVVK